MNEAIIGSFGAGPYVLRTSTSFSATPVVVVVIFDVVMVEVNKVLDIAVVVDCIVIFAVVDCIVVGCIVLAVVVGCIVVVSFSCEANHTPTPMPVPNLSCR